MLSHSAAQFPLLRDVAGDDPKPNKKTCFPQQRAVPGYCHPTVTIDCIKMSRARHMASWCCMKLCTGLRSLFQKRPQPNHGWVTSSQSAVVVPSGHSSAHLEQERRRGKEKGRQPPPRNKVALGDPDRSIEAVRSKVGGAWRNLDLIPRTMACSHHMHQGRVAPGCT